MSPDIISIGELLIDFIAVERNTPLQMVNKFQKFPGGAPANVMVTVGSLGLSSGLISKVGDDAFGDFLIKALTQKKVDTSQILRDKKHHTGIVFVESQEGIPEFMLYSDVAYNFLKPEEINQEYIKNSKIINFGGVLLLKSPARDAVMRALSFAKNNVTISFDLNLRKDLLKNESNLWEYVKKALSFVDIFKISMDELFDLYLYFNPQKKEPTYKQAINYFIETYNFKIIAITMGGSGSRILIIKNREIKSEVTEPVYKVKIIDSTGAGDAYLGALLASLISLNKHKNPEEVNKNEVEKIIKFCNKYAALSTTQIGAWNLPKIELFED
ncbi:MAG: carbohydrate kinase family protein [Candidatus Helarchaeota archaeon]